MIRRLALLLLLLPAAALAVAVDDERLPDPVDEARARMIMADIRCLVCQNQSIEDSNADLARDLRRIVREQVAAGRSEDEIKTWLVARYGDWVLLKPPFKAETAILWALAPLLLLGAAIAVARTLRRRRTAGPAPLSAEERKRLDAILGRDRS